MAKIKLKMVAASSQQDILQLFRKEISSPVTIGATDMSEVDEEVIKDKLYSLAN